MAEKHYGAIDGLRTIAAFGIVMMHVATNKSYVISGFVYETILPYLTNFVFGSSGFYWLNSICSYSEDDY